MPSIAQREAPGRPSPDAALWVRSALILYSLLFAVSLVWTGCEQRSLVFASPEAAAAGVSWGRDAAAGLAAGLALVAASRVFSTRLASGRALRAVLSDLLGRLDAGTCLVLAALSGIAEEAFFRGALQPRTGLVAASLLFGLAHFVPRRELLAWPVFGVAAGLLFGALFVATGNLVAPVIAHVCVNALNLRWLASGGGAGAAREGSIP
jgi:hypothetical protein